VSFYESMCCWLIPDVCCRMSQCAAGGVQVLLEEPQCSWRIQRISEEELDETRWLEETRRCCR
jgi:hypothetical protein